MGGDRVLPDDLRMEILSSVKPDRSKREEIEKNASDLLGAVNETLREMSLHDVNTMLVGSVSKGTMTTDPDLDIFLIFPADTGVEELERIGLRVGSAVLNDAEKKYTQHPYMTGTFRGMNADIVPCLSMPRGSRVVTAVDRTPYHTEYINANLRGDQRDEVRLLKSFLKGIGAYGAEDVVCGFSGYLTELMVIRFGDFDGVIRHLSSLRFDDPPPASFEVVRSTGKNRNPPEILKFDSDPYMREVPLDDEVYRKMFPRDSLIFIDPVDPTRNVASPVSEETLSHANRKARSLIEKPSVNSFWPASKRPVLPGDDIPIPGIFGDHIIHILDLPEGNPGIVISQLRRSLGRCRDELKRSGFESVEIGFPY
ncbi:MAG: nucleotidyltransferase domain-containing protein [Thermoplasmatota archaeon]